MNTLQKIIDLVEESKKFPDPIIEYNFDIPKVDGITSTEFFGVKARFNKNVPKSVGASLIYHY